jgi:hypothetical protein
MRAMTVGVALAEKRRQLRGKVIALTLCKRELFYALREGEPRDTSPEGSVYPVSGKMAEIEAKFFGVPWSEE